MTAKTNDTRQKQILRGEVWFGSFHSNSVAVNATGIWLFVTTDVNEVEFNLEIVAKTSLTIKLWETPTVNFAGVPVTPINMRIASSNTTSVTTKGDGTAVSYTHLTLPTTPYV